MKKYEIINICLIIANFKCKDTYEISVAEEITWLKILKLCVKFTNLILFNMIYSAIRRKRFEC